MSGSLIGSCPWIHETQVLPEAYLMEKTLYCQRRVENDVVYRAPQRRQKA